MAIVRMTSEEIDKKYPLDKKALAQIKKACQKEPDMTDPDNPDITELLEKGLAHIVGRPKKDVCKEHINLRLDSFVLVALRETGKGWQTRLSNYISQGVKSGALLKRD